MGITQTNALARELLSIIERRIAEKRQADPKLDYGESWRGLPGERPASYPGLERGCGGAPKGGLPRSLETGGARVRCELAGDGNHERRPVGPKRDRSCASSD